MVSSRATYNNLTPVSIQNTVHSVQIDELGRTANISQFGDVISMPRYNHVLTQFQYIISTSETDVTGSYGGGSFSSASMGIVTSSIASNGYARIQTRRSIRYVPGHEAYSYFTALFLTSSDGLHQRIGCFDNGDGFYFGYSGSYFGIGWRNNFQDTFISQSQFSKDKLDGTGPSKFNLAYDKFNVYGVKFAWLGTSPINFHVMSEDGSWVICHQISIPNQYTVPSIRNPVLPIRMEVSKSSGTVNGEIRTASWNGGAVLFQDTDLPNRHFNYRSSKNITANVLTNILTISNTGSFHSLENKIVMEFNSSNFVADGTKSVVFDVYKNCVLLSASYKSVDSVNSVSSVDVSGTISSTGSLVTSFAISKVDSLYVSDLVNHGIILFPNETLTVSALSSNNSEIVASLNWHDKF